MLPIKETNCIFTSSKLLRQIDFRLNDNRLLVSITRYTNEIRTMHHHDSASGVFLEQ